MDMKEQLKSVSQAFEGMSDGLDGIIEALRGHLPPKPPPPPPSPIYTKCYYEDEYENEFHDDEITPTLVNDIFYDSSHGGEPIKIEFGTCVQTIQDSSFENYRSPPIFIFPKNGHLILDHYSFTSGHNLDIYFQYNSISEIQSEESYPWGIDQDGTTMIHCSNGNITI